MLLFETACNQLHLRSCIDLRAPGRELPDDGERPIAPIHALFRRQREGCRHVGGVRELEARRRNPDDGVGLLIEQDLPADDGRVRSEPPFPQPVADDDAAVVARLFLVGSEGVALCRCDTQQLEEARRDAVGLHSLGLDVCGRAAFQPCQAARRSTVRAWSRQSRKLPGATASPSEGPSRSAKDHQPLRILEPKRPQQQRVHHAEHGRVETEAERECQSNHD